jgi:2-hydroxy-6-oxonona-2,4-dienedioate hydrolase
MELQRISGLAARVTGAGEPLVLLHGGMGSWNHWTRNIDALAGRFTLYLLDMPGYGDSPAVPRDIPDDDYVALVVATVAEISREQPVRLGGFSFGGVIAALVAASLQARVSALSLVGAGGFGKSPVALDLRQFPPKEEGPTALRAVLRHNLAALMIADPGNITEEAIDLQLANVRRTRFDGRHVSLSDKMPPALKRIPAPVQMIWGELDVLPYPNARARADAASAARPDVRIDLVPGAGHWVQFEAPEAVNSAMLEFLEGRGSRVQ